MIGNWLRRIFRRPPRPWPGDGDTVRIIISPGRSTTRRPGETWSEAMNRLTDGEDL